MDGLLVLPKRPISIVLAVCVVIEGARMFVVLVEFTEPPNWSTGAALSTPLRAMIPPDALADVAPQLHV